MRTKFLVVLGVALAGALVMGNACEDVQDGSEKLCGPCPDVTAGGASVTGDARVDGFFRAVGNLKVSFDGAKGAFDASLAELAAIYDLDISAMSTAEAAAAIKGAIQADLEANVEGGVSVEYEPPSCTANASLAVEAQAKCEVEAGCQVDADCTAGKVDVQCSGQCSGSCSGSCSGTLQCKAELDVDGKCEGSCQGTCEVQSPSFACTGTCTGTCTVEAGAHCEGTCSGECTGTCDGSPADGVACDGVCEGTCSATCTMTGKAKCEGTCDGSCEYEPGDAQCEGTCKGECYITADADVGCEGEAKCEGTCEGSCSGGCEGEVVPPSCSVDAECDASADCQASAKAEASASIECTPPSLRIDYALKGSLDAKARAEFTARIEKVRAGLTAVAHSMGKLKALVEGSGQVDPPAVALQASLQAIADAVANGDLDIDVPAFRIGCVAGAVNDAVSALKTVATEGKAMVQAQIDLLGVVGLGQ